MDNDFLADARNPDATPLRAGPRLGDTNPAGAFVGFLVVTVPMKLNLHAAKLIRVDLLTGGTHDNGRLGTTDNGTRRNPQRPKGGFVAHAREAIAVRIRNYFTADVAWRLLR